MVYNELLLYAQYMGKTACYAIHRIGYWYRLLFKGAMRCLEAL